MSFGVAIHLHSKTDELITNLKIIKNLWTSNNIHVSAHCNDKDSYDIIESLDNLDRYDLKSIKFSDNKKLNQRMRCHDTVVRSILLNDSEYVVQWHSDAYALDDDIINDMINKMRSNGYLVACRGRGFNFRSGKCPCGDVDDHFMIYHKDSFAKREPMNLPLPQFLSVYCNESLWAYFIANRYAPDQILFYSDMSENITSFSSENAIGSDKEGWYNDKIDHRNLHPYNIDLKRKFFHIGQKDLTKDILIKNGVPEDLIYITDRENKPKYTL